MTWHSISEAIQEFKCHLLYENALPPLVDLVILGTIKSPEFCDLKERDGL